MDGPIITVLTKIFNIFAVSILWLIGCIPIVTIGTSTAAMYYTTVKVTRRENGYLWREFWRSYKQNLKTGIPATLIMIVIIFLMLFNRYYTDQLESSLATAFMVIYTSILVIVIAMILYLFPVLSRFNMTLGNLLKMSFYMSLRHFPFTIIMLIIFAAGFIASFYCLPVLVFVPGLVCLVNSFMMEKVLHRYMEKPEEGSEEAEKWYNYDKKNNQ